MWGICPSGWHWTPLLFQVPSYASACKNIRVCRPFGMSNDNFTMHRSCLTVTSYERTRGHNSELMLSKCLSQSHQESYLLEYNWNSNVLSLSLTKSVSYLKSEKSFRSVAHACTQRVTCVSGWILVDVDLAFLNRSRPNCFIKYRSHL